MDAFEFIDELNEKLELTDKFEPNVGDNGYIGEIEEHEDELRSDIKLSGTDEVID